MENLKPLKWKNANRNEFPPAGERVLISADGVYYIATFNKASMHFVVNLEDEGEELLFAVENSQIYWTEFYDKLS